MFNARPEQPINEHQDDLQFTSGFINDELDLITSQQHNLVSLASQLENAQLQTENMKKLINIIKEFDSVLLKGIDEKRRRQASAMVTIEEIKKRLSSQKYEDVDRLLNQMHQGSQDKIRLSQSELNKMRDALNQLQMLYMQISGLYRILQAVQSMFTQTYEAAQQEIAKEMQEEEGLNKAGAYQNQMPPPGPVYVAKERMLIKREI